MSKNGKDRLDRIEELLNQTALLNAQTAKNLEKYAKEWRQELKQMRDEHNREMKEIRTLFRKMIERIAI